MIGDYFHIPIFPADLFNAKDSGFDIENHIIFKHVDFGRIKKSDNQVIIKFRV